MLMALVRNTIVRNILGQHPPQSYSAAAAIVVVASAFSPTNSIQSAAIDSRRTGYTMLSSLSATSNNDAVAVPLSFIQTETPATTSRASSTAPPPIVLLHGLDSSSHTWTTLIEELGAEGYKAIAVDQRGCGHSPLGNPQDFTPATLVEDLYQCVAQHPLFWRNTNNSNGKKELRPFVVVGHSMGGRVAMSFAAKYPELVAALIIEDMDIRSRPMSLSAIQSKDRTATINFDRTFSKIGNNKEEIVKLLENEGYPPARVESWFTGGRIEQKPNTETGDYYYYSHVNPAFRLLCYEQFFATDHGETTWTQLVKSRYSGNGTLKIVHHLFVADPSMTVCDETSITRMQEIHMKNITDLGPNRSFQITRYPGATHSIHNSASEQFTHDLKAIIDAL